MIYQKPEIKIIKNMDLNENIGPAQTGYAQVMWVQTQSITFNQQAHTNHYADATIVKLEKQA
jgi:hypothetical protein